MSTFRFQVQEPSGRVVEIIVEGNQALLGSAAHADVRLPVGEALPEHVEIRRVGGGVLARALSFEPTPLLDGAAFGEAPVSSGAVLTVGGARLRVLFDEIDVADGKASRSRRRSRPLVVIGAGLMIVVMLLMIVGDLKGAGPSLLAPEAAPPLWGEPVTSCSRGDARQARVLARDRLVLAESKRERSPFSARDGVAAVPLFEEASACFRAGADVDNAQRVASEAAALRAVVNREYHHHQIRLEHALAISDSATADRELIELIALTDGKTGPYVTWLSVQHRHLRLQLDQAKKTPPRPGLK